MSSQYADALLVGLRRLLERTGYDGPLSTEDDVLTGLKRFHAVADEYPACVVWAYLSGGKPPPKMEYVCPETGELCPKPVGGCEECDRWS